MERYKAFLFRVMTVVVLMAASIGSALAQDYDLSGYSVESKKAKIHTEWGVGVCGIYTGITAISTEDIRLRPRIGFQGHLDMAVCFGRNFAIETEISYEGGSIDVAMGKLEHRVRTRTMDIPILLSLRALGGRIRIAAGPLFTVMSRSEYTEGGDLRLFGPISPTWNLTAGVGIGLSKHFILEARYIHPLDDTLNQFGAKEGNPGLEFSTRAYRITAGVTVLF